MSARIGRWVLAVGLAHCLAPTEITLWLSTDVACVDVHGVGVAVGSQQTLQGANGAVGYDCSSDGGLGSVVVVPSGAIDERVAIRVTLGVGDASVETCPSNGGPGCIVARRELPYSPHDPLTLPIELESSCINHVCSPDQTCASGTCVDAGVACANGVCDLPDTGVADAGPAPACIPMTMPVPIGATADPNLRPRIARFPGGYAVTYGMPSGGLAATLVTLDASGNPVATTPVALLPTSMVITHMGPLATDGKTYIFSYTSGGGPVTILYADLTGASNGTNLNTVIGSTQPTSEGFFLDPTGVYVTAAIGGSTTFRIQSTPMKPASYLTGGTEQLSNLSLGAAAGTYYGAMTGVLQDCSFQSFAVNGAGFTPGTNVGPSLTSQCVAARVGASGSLVLYAYVLALAGSTLEAAVGSGTQLDMGPLQGPNWAFVVLPTMGPSFRLLWQTGMAIVGAPFDATTMTAPMPSTVVGGHGTPYFDAVSDDPVSSTAYAVVLVSSSGQVLFWHQCT